MINTNRFREIFTHRFVAAVVEPSLYEVAYGQGESYMQCLFTWDEASHSVGFLPGLVWYLKSHNTENSIVWFSSGDDVDKLYAGHKPFTIHWVGITGQGSVILSVKGQKTEKIKKKWTKRLGKKLDRTVILIWEEGEDR